MQSKSNPQLSWYKTAKGRLKFELAGIAFGRKLGATPEDYARHLWSVGALDWMGGELPTAGEYLSKEASAFRLLYPKVVFQIEALSDDYARLIFTNGCLGGWGDDQWGVAQSLGLSKGLVCRYCREAFRVWSRQLSLDALPRPKTNGTCYLEVKRRTG